MNTISSFVREGKDLLIRTSFHVVDLADAASEASARDDRTADRYRAGASIVPRTRDRLRLLNLLRATSPRALQPSAQDAASDRGAPLWLPARRRLPGPVVTVGKSARNSARDWPRSAYSRRVWTGTHVPANTGVPLRMSGSTWMTVACFITVRIHLGSSAANGRRPKGMYAQTGRPVSFYRLSAVCQPKLQNVVAGAGNQRYLQLWSVAA